MNDKPPLPNVAPHGSWTSPITAESLAGSEIRLGDLRPASDRLYWTESRPDQGGRTTIVTGEREVSSVRDLTPTGFNVRTRVHEYGGAAFLIADQALVFSNFADQRLYRQDLGDAPGSVPRAMTPAGRRYADGVVVPGGSHAIFVCEDHDDPAEVKNLLVILSLTDEPTGADAGRVLFDQSDFVAFPRVSPDGRRLAFIGWSHPNMPWDTTTLYVADLQCGEQGAATLGDIIAVAGGRDESVLEPQWSADGSLYFISDRTDFWTLYVWRRGSIRAALAAPEFGAAEHAGPLWSLGQANYALLGDGRALARLGQGGIDSLALIDLEAGTARILSLPFVGFEQVQASGPDAAVMIARSADQTAALIRVDAKTGAYRLLRRPAPATTPPAYVSRAEPVSFASKAGRTVHAFYYPPRNSTAMSPPGVKPPLLVHVHGGPTGQSTTALRLDVQFWTSRGFAVVDVNYSGSSGHGRAYRQRLNGEWGVADVEDVVAAAKYLIEGGRADPERVAIRGASAGGYTVLAALSQTEVFKAGADYYGVCDVAALARDTHKFESRYLDTLVGPYPAAKAVYEHRSPLNHLAGFKAPLIVLQGADDPIVPLNQAQMIVDALRGCGAPVAYVEFAGEGHGFRRPDSNIRAIQAELYFYGRVFGFKPADALPTVSIDNLADREEDARA